MIPPPAVGNLVANHFRLEELTGEREHSTTWRATQIGMGRAVTLEMMRPEWLESLAARQEFLENARRAQRLDHPNTIRVYDLDQTEHGVPFVVYEHVEGYLLEGLAQQGPLETPRIARIIGQVLKALAAAHDVGVTHGSVDATTVLLSDIEGSPDFVRLFDFNRTRRDATIAEDLRATAALLRRLITGAFEDSTASWPLQPVDSPLDKVIARTDGRSSSGPFATAEEMLDGLESALHPMAPPAARPARVTGRWSLGRVASYGAALIVGVGVLGLLAGLLTGWNRPIQASEPRHAITETPAPRPQEGPPPTPSVPAPPTPPRQPAPSIEHRLAPLWNGDMERRIQAAGYGSDNCAQGRRSGLVFVLCPIRGRSNGSALLTRFELESDAIAAERTELERQAVVVRLGLSTISVWLQPRDYDEQERILRLLMP